jgi:glycosyltransferase involved in cell wall biosynthesis
VKVACISHGSIVALNRRPFDLLASAHGVDITVIVPDIWAGDLPAPAIRFAPQPGGATCRALPVRRSGNGSFFTLKGLGETLRGIAPDLVLLDEEPWSLAAWQTLRAGIRAPLLFYTKQNIVKRLPPPFGWLRRATYRRAMGAWAVGGTTADVLTATGFTKPVDIVPHGVEISAFVPGRDDERRRALGLEGIVIGYAGRLVEEKGIRDLLDAAKLLANLSPGTFSVLIVGAGPLESEVRHAMAHDGVRIHLLPAVPHHEAPSLYRLMDIFVLPSRETPRWREQFGRALVEAAATALPIVAAGTGEIPHVMAGLGGGGRVVPPEAPAKLATALHELVADTSLRSSIGAANLDAARSVYSQEAIAARMAALLFTPYPLPHTPS